MRQRFFFTQCEKIPFKAFLTIIIYYRKKKATATRRVQGGNYREAREVPPARSLRCSAKSQRQKPAVQCEKPTHLTPCLVHTHGVCLAFRRLAVHCAHSRSVSRVPSARRALCTLTECAWRFVGSPCNVHTHGVCLAFRRLAVHCAHSRSVPGVPSACRALCKLTECAVAFRRLAVHCAHSRSVPGVRRLAVHCAHSRSVPGVPSARRALHIY